ncbi:hypothetical protein FLJC2902T_17160 [Flavobacterium limnosediminis JC2902]|uniref:Uncharacterized protein n=1 Tax=Flavobacterium limnosediminis JC2902 TaxID=1341181 RepID=V6SVB3_9FLAO|nr:hypothetical protein [Flavobacterium limnosediminis]ESU28365.1 hypothetical protein FLJC2902T_17160 [Flavobacterium limnosediminis JC2902]
MKKFILPFFLGVVVTSGVAFKAVTDIKRNSAEVYESAKFKNLCVFTDSKPLMQYDTIGKVHINPYTRLYYSEIRDRLLEKCNENYPKADGFILSRGKDGNGYDGHVIQFKK